MKLRGLVPNIHIHLTHQKQDFHPIKSIKIKYANFSKNLR